MQIHFRRVNDAFLSPMRWVRTAVATALVLSGVPAIAAEFGGATVSPAARSVAIWVAETQDHGRQSFVIIDKREAMLYVFDAQARMRGSSPVLLGAASGDDTAPGIGDRPLSLVLPLEKTTPAGRFVAEHGKNNQGEEIVWVDYDAAVSMHRVRPAVAAERRLQRLASKTASDNRISFGCINVPKAFYETQLSPAMATRRSVVYILPEQKSLEEVFGPGVLATQPVETKTGVAKRKNAGPLT